MGFITNHYLASENCRREMNFALKRQIPYLSIMLEEVTMSAGVEMQLSANQAIFKYKMPSEEDFYRMINVTGVLQSSRELPAPKPEPAKPEAVKPEPVKPEAVKPEPAVPAAPPAAKAPKEKKAKEKPPKDAQPAAKKPLNKKALMIAAIALAAVAAVTVAVIIIAGGSGDKTADSKPSSGSQSTNSQSTNSQSTNSQSTNSQSTELQSSDLTADEGPQANDIDFMAAPDTPVSKESLLTYSPYAGRVLWGKRTFYYKTDSDLKTYFLNESKYADLAVDGGTLNLSELPYAVEVRRDDHPDIIRLTYLDQLGTEYIVQAAFAISGGKLTLSPCDKAFSDAKVIAQELKLQISLYNDSVELKTIPTGSSYARTARYINDHTAVSGSAENAEFKEVSGVEVKEFTVGSSVTVQFDDGGSAPDAKIEAYYDGSAALKLSWTKKKRLYNGSMGDFEVSKYMWIYYLNTYPYGFILIDTDNNVYFYQKPLSE